ncbi:MAG: hypothetical protein AB4062_01505 [Crocosphaera sp.]
MNHGQKHPSVRQRPTSESLEQDNQSRNLNLPKLEKATTFISVQESSSTNTPRGLWNHQPISLKQNGWTSPNPSCPKKVPKPSFPVFFWETLMTVALLIMALWMQSLPTRELPQTIKNNTWPSSEISEPQSRF